MAGLAELIARLDGSDPSAAREEIARQGALAVAPLQALLKSGTPKQAANAVLILGELAGPEVLPDLLGMLQHSSLLVRMNTAQVLGSLPAPETVAALLKALRGEKELVQVWIIRSLGTIGDPIALPALIDLLHTTTSSTVRYTAIQALGNMPDPGSIQHIQRYLDDENRHVRHYAHEAMAKLSQLH